MKRLSLIVIIGFFGHVCPLLSQINGIQESGPLYTPDADNSVIDGVVLPSHIPTKKPMKYEDIREADYIWSKRVYRVIDLREKMNYALKYPMDVINDSNWQVNSNRYSLWTIMRKHILDVDVDDRLVLYFDAGGDFGPYDGDQFKYPFRYKGKSSLDIPKEKEFRLKRLFFSQGKQTTAIQAFDGSDSVIQDPVTGIYDVQYNYDANTWVDGNDIIGYELKEDWFFDKERSVLDVRIIGIAPLVNWDVNRTKVITFDRDETTGATIASGDIGFTGPLFWLYFPHLRPVLSNHFVFNEDNDAQWMSFDDFFWKRRFSSYILKESNVFDRQVESYRYGIDALIESEAITEEIRTLEHDMWNF
jgi:gliding motility associated protien GldN